MITSQNEKFKQFDPRKIELDLSDPSSVQFIEVRIKNHQYRIPNKRNFDLFHLEELSLTNIGDSTSKESLILFMKDKIPKTLNKLSIISENRLELSKFK